jgi:hypothetical protein
MNDDATPDDQTAPPAGPPADSARDVERDGELAAVLAVAPLEDLTRRRLVHTALAGRPRAARPVGRVAAALGVAAALVIGAVIGTVVVTRPDDPEPTTAAGPPVSSPAPSAAPSSAPNPRAPAFEPASATRLGDLGAVGSVSALREAITRRLESGNERAASSPGDAVDTDVCVARGPGAAGLVVISAIGTATLDATPAVVLVGPTPRGANLALALDPVSCAVLGTVTLPD